MHRRAGVTRFAQVWASAAVATLRLVLYHAHICHRKRYRGLDARPPSALPLLPTRPVRNRYTLMNAPAVDETSWYVDTDYLGTPNLIAAGVIESDEGYLIVDPGPTSSLDTLTARLDEDGIAWDDVHALLLTHIHLDHAGATGTIVDAADHVQVYVHERGAGHMIRPERLMKSVRRIYGEETDRLWGEFKAVPEASVHVLSGGETLEIGGRSFDVAYTPGHAQHHVSYLNTDTGTAYIGDVGGMRVTGSTYAMPVAPPPDVDIEAWLTSMEIIRAWQPERIFLTHFGPSDDVDQHFDALEVALTEYAKRVRELLETGDDPEAMADTFEEEALEVMRANADEEYWEAYHQFGQPRESFYGCMRYWHKRAEAEASGS